VATYYFDTNALIKYYRQTELGRLNLRRLVATNTILISALTQLEFTNVLMKEYRRQNIRKAQAVALIKRMRRDTSLTGMNAGRPFQSIELPSGIFRGAEALLWQHYRIDIVANDALHIAIADKLMDNHSDLEMVTSDKGVKFVCGQINLMVFDPETPQ
jgi:predicted nucleic acid-binding protein